MSELAFSLILGLVQGLTEFIPVSSTGHLIAVRELFLIEPQRFDLAFDAVLQLATALAIAVYFRRELLSLFRTLLGALMNRDVPQEELTLVKSIFWGTVPAVLIGLFIQDYMGSLFRNGILVAAALLAGSLLMLYAERKATQTAQLSIGRGVIIGLFQALALIPGISRSGATIAGGLCAGLTRENAARFSFLLAFPILSGTGIFKLYELYSLGILSKIGIDLLLGSIVAFISGLAAIHFLLRFLKQNSLRVFVVYRVLLAAVIIVLLT